MYMPILSSKGYRVFVEKVTNDESLFDIFKIFKYFCMQTDIRFVEGGFDNGDAILFDCNNIDIFKFVIFVPYFVKSLTLLLQVTTSVKICGFWMEKSSKQYKKYSC